MSENKYIIPGMTKQQADFLQAPMSRREAGEMVQSISNQAVTITTHDMCLAFLLEKLGYTPEDVSTWVKAKSDGTVQAGAEARN